MGEIDQYIDIIRLVGAGVVGGLIATYAGHMLTKNRDQIAGKKRRKDEFLAFMRQWRHEMERWHFKTGGRERNEMAFYDGVSSFCFIAETIKNDISSGNRKRFDELLNTIAKHGELKHGSHHEQRIKTIDEIVEIAAEN